LKVYYKQRDLLVRALAFKKAKLCLRVCRLKAIRFWAKDASTKNSANYCFGIIFCKKIGCALRA